MIFLPAIDIRDGKAVRLAQGDFAQETVYDADPLSAARAWVEGGARWLHVVDLDGARDGAPANLEHLERIAGELGVPVQFGGGRLRAALGGEVGEQAQAGGARLLGVELDAEDVVALGRAAEALSLIHI